MDRMKRLVALGGAVAALTLCAPGAGAGGGQGVVIIANASVGEGELPQKVLQDMFLGDRSRWGDDQRVVIATQKGGGVHEMFLEGVMRKTGSQFSTYWKKQVFTGKGKMPPALAGDGEMVEFVQATQGAIGYVGAVPARDGVKVIQVLP